MKVYIIVTFIAALLFIVGVIFSVVGEISSERAKKNSLEDDLKDDLDEVWELKEELEKELALSRSVMNFLGKHPEFAKDFFVDYNTQNCENPIEEDSARYEKRHGDTASETPFCFGENKDEE